MTNYYAYENDRLTFINSNNSVGYKFTYDNFGRTLKNEVGNGTEFRTLSTMYYDKHLLIGQAYGNGDYINYSYDNLDRLTEIKYNDNENKKKTYVYGTDGNVSSVLDTASNTRTKYVYDLSGRLVETKEYSGTNLSGNQIVSNTEYFYQDRTNYLTWMNHNSPLGNLAVAFDYGILANGQMPDQVYNVWWNYTTHLSRSFDGLGRLSSTVINPNVNNKLTTNYYYKDVSDTQTTTQLQRMVTPAGEFTYTYDSLGNITSIVTANSEGTFTSTYEYDALNQLVRENDQKNNVTYTYEYLNGNILSKKQYAYTTGELGAVVNTINYGYGDNVWKDLLTSYNGNAITYDNIGNMTSFNGKTYSWLGRQLQSISGLATYTYNMDGLRTSKTANGVTTNYYYNGSTLAGQISSDGTKLIFLYDENGDIFGLTYQDANYYYIKNAQNDVIAIADAWGNILCRYEYDAWGKVLSITGDVAWFGQINPIRYRSYYYDNESGMYYLQSRYYNPEIGRFICADEASVVTASLGSANYNKNVFAYCDNNPVVRVDVSGMLWETVFDVVSLCVSVADVYSDPTDVWAWVGLVGDIVDLVPFVTCVGESVKAVRIVNTVDNFVDGFGGLSRAREFGIKSYTALRKLTKGTDLQAHHIIEKRLVKHLGINTNDMLCVAVTAAEHQKFTNAWREAFKLGTDYHGVTREVLWEKAQIIYKNYPELLDAAEKILFE